MDAVIALSYNKAPKLPPNNVDLDFIRERYDELVREHDDLAADTMDFTCKEGPDADSDGELDCPLTAALSPPQL